MSPIKTGFVGLSAKGWASVALGPSLCKSPHYSLVAVCTSSPESAKASAEAQAKIAGHPVKAYHGSTDDLASDPDVDFVAVSVKAPLHKQSLLPVINASKDFFVEWPAGRSLEESVEIARLAKEKGLKTMVGLQGRHNPTVGKVKEIIDSGKIGKVLASSVIAFSPRELRYWAPEITAGGIYANDPANGATLLDIIVGHHLDLFTYTLGDFSNVTSTTAVHYPTASVLDDAGKPTGETIPSPAEDQIAFTGILKSGAISSTVWRTSMPSTPGREHFLWTIDGEEGSIKIVGDSSNLHIRDPKLYLNGELVDVPDVGLFGYLSSAWEEFSKGENGTHARIEDAVKLHRLLDAIRFSAKEGRRIDL